MSEKRGHIIIDRVRDNGIQTIARAWALVNGSKKLKFVTLEPSWVLNVPYISCADIGDYRVVKRYSKQFGDHFKLMNVKGRSQMLIHTLNFFNDTEGCIGPGERFKLQNDDQYVDVINSGKVMANLNDIMPDEFQLTIKEHNEFQRMYVTDGDKRGICEIDDGRREMARREK